MLTLNPVAGLVLLTWINLQWTEDARKPWQLWPILTHLLFLAVQLVGAEWVGWG